MNHYLFTARSVTMAQRMGQVLGQGKLPHSVQRMPVGLTTQGCTYAVRVPEQYFDTALERLQNAGLMPVKIYFHDNNGYSEVTV